MTKYSVEGFWPFPVDMLRYDGSEPASEDDKKLIASLGGKHPPEGYEGNEKTRISLVLNEDSYFRPAVGRWESFDWDVVGHPESRQRAVVETVPKIPVPAKGIDPLRAALARCRECWEDDQATDIGREKLDGLAAFGLLRKVGRGRWEITPEGLSLLGQTPADLGAARAFEPHYETVRRCEEIARYFSDREFRNMTAGFNRGIAYAAESIAGEISDLVHEGPRAPVIAEMDFDHTKEELSPHDYQFLVRLMEENRAGGLRPVIETNAERWCQAYRLSDMGLIAIEQLAVGGRLHVTRLATHLLKSTQDAGKEKDAKNEQSA